MKVKDIKSKVAAKVAKGKAKVAKNCGRAAKCAVAFLALAVMFGCQNPAQRAQTADTRVYVYGTATFGSEFVSLAQSNETGGNDAGQVATPTNTTDIRPDVDVNTTGGRSAGVLESIVGAFGAWLTTPSGKEAAAKCEGGNCATGTCTDGSCSKCTDCTP